MPRCTARSAAAATSRSYDDGLLDGAEHALRTEAELNHALRRGELVVHYQPQVALGGGRALAGVEALVRWRHPERGLVGPDEFLGTAEDSGLIRRLGAWVLDEACRQLAELAGTGPRRRRRSPWRSTCPHASWPTSDLVAAVAATLAEHGLPPAALCLEVPESVLLDGGDALATGCGRCATLGVRVAVDDFGAGWSSPRPARAASRPMR